MQSCGNNTYSFALLAAGSSALSTAPFAADSAAQPVLHGASTLGKEKPRAVLEMAAAQIANQSATLIQPASPRLVEFFPSSSDFRFVALFPFRMFVNAASHELFLQLPKTRLLLVSIPILPRALHSRPSSYLLPPPPLSSPASSSLDK